MEHPYAEESHAPTKSPFVSTQPQSSFHLPMLVMASLSALMHALFMLGIRKLCGFGARSAYLILGTVAFLGFSYSLNTVIVSLLSIGGLKIKDCVTVWRMSGGILVATALSASFVHVYLLLQRIVCIFFPLKANVILCRSVVLIVCFLTALFYLGVIALLCLSPYAGIAYDSRLGSYAIMRQLPYSYMLLSANKISNYVVVLSSAIAYPILLLLLRFKLKSSRNLKEEMRLTLQVTLSIGLELIFFFIWEFLHVEQAVQILISTTSDLWYYNAVTLPYFVMNKNLHKELTRLICRRNLVKVTVVEMKPQTMTRG